MADPFHEAGEAGLMADRADDAAQPGATALLAWTGRVEDQFVGFDEQRIFGFDGLDRQVRSVGDVDLDAVLAVLAGTPAEAAAQRLEIEIGLAGARIDAGEDRRGVR